MGLPFQGLIVHSAGEYFLMGELGHQNRSPGLSLQQIKHKSS